MSQESLATPCPVPSVPMIDDNSPFFTPGPFPGSASLPAPIQDPTAPSTGSRGQDAPIGVMLFNSTEVSTPWLAQNVKARPRPRIRLVSLWKWWLQTLRILQQFIPRWFRVVLSLIRFMASNLSLLRPRKLILCLCSKSSVHLKPTPSTSFPSPVVNSGQRHFTTHWTCVIKHPMDYDAQAEREMLPKCVLRKIPSELKSKILTQSDYTRDLLLTWLKDDASKLEL